METGVSENGVKYTVISDNTSHDLEKLLEIYALDKRKAKIIFENRKGSVRFIRNRFVLFEYPNGDFRFAHLERNFGVSKTNIIYNRETCSDAYGMKNGKFYKIQHKRPCLLTANNLWHGSNKLDSFEGKYLLGRFGWLRNLFEDHRCHGLDLNCVVKHKLYNIKACLRYIYKVPYPVANMLSENHGTYNPWDFFKMWKEMKKSLINVENLKASLFNDTLFKDTTLMANSLGYKVNCSWTNKRLKIEHDKMVKEVVDVILEFEELRELKIKPIFQKFAEYSGYELLTTNHELIEEGKMMHHCVGTYSGAVDGGRCAIYRVFGHTLQLNFTEDWSLKNNKQNKKISIGQYMGYDNSAPPSNLLEEVKTIINNFNLEHYDELNQTITENIFDLKAELPF